MTKSKPFSNEMLPLDREFTTNDNVGWLVEGHLPIPGAIELNIYLYIQPNELSIKKWREKKVNNKIETKTTATEITVPPTKSKENNDEECSSMKDTLSATNNHKKKITFSEKNRCFITMVIDGVEGS